jgi:hypothetical protein
VAAAAVWSPGGAITSCPPLVVLPGESRQKSSCPALASQQPVISGGKLDAVLRKEVALCAAADLCLDQKQH